MNAADSERQPERLSGHRPDSSAESPPTWGIVPPQPRRLVLACRCGNGLDLVDMHRARFDNYFDRPRSGFRIEPIRCRHCALPG